jgi:hypothetical protein
MTRSQISGACVAAALVAGLSFAPATASAAPAAASFGGVAETTSGNSLTQDVRHHRGHWRNGYGRRHGYGRRRHDGWGWGAAAAAGLLLSAPLWAGGYDHGDYDDSYSGAYAYGGGGGGYARCRATFRSFDPESGTYVGYDGVRRMCPYL